MNTVHILCNIQQPPADAEHVRSVAMPAHEGVQAHACEH